MKLATLPMLVLALLLPTILLTSCESIPIEAYSLSSDPLPANAQLVSQTQYAALQAQPGFYAIYNQSIGEQQQSAQAQEQSDDAVISAFERVHPELGPLLPPAPRERGTKLNRDGTYTHTVRLGDSRTLTVRTMGRRWLKQTLRHTIDGYSTRENQLSLYRQLYRAAGTALQSQLSLPDPESAVADEAGYTAERVAALNDSVTSVLSARRPAHLAPVFTAPSCGDEIGQTAAASDETGNSYDNPSCGPQRGGLYLAYDWPSKPYLTCVKNQGNRGTCGAFGSASAIESLVASSTGKFVNLSEQYFYQQAKTTGIRDDFDDGVVDWVVLGEAVLFKWQIPYENMWAYNPSPARLTNSSAHLYTHSCDGYTGPCSDSSHQMQVYCSDNGTARYCGFQAEAGGGATVGISSTSEIWSPLDTTGSLNRIIALVNQGQPVLWAFSDTPSWDNASAQGFVNYVAGEGNRGGHIVHITGAVDNATLAQVLPGAPPGAGGGYLIMKNSWTNCFADGGFVYVPYSYVLSYTTGADSLAL